MKLSNSRKTRGVPRRTYAQVKLKIEMRRLNSFILLNVDIYFFTPNTFLTIELKCVIEIAFLTLHLLIRMGGGAELAHGH